MYWMVFNAKVANRKKIMSIGQVVSSLGLNYCTLSMVSMGINTVGDA